MELEVTGEPVEMTSSLPEHLIWLSGEHWALWNWVGLRGAGFPADQVLALADSPSAALADQLLTVEAESQQTQAEALDTVRGALDALRSSGQWDNLDQRNRLLGALRDLKKGRLLEPDAVVEIPASTLRALYDLQAQYKDVRKQFDAAFEIGTTRVSQSICEIAANDRFCEALIWQNRRAFYTGVAALRQPRGGGGRNSRQRQHEEMVANYLQRYCVKNDTIGFFGPVGWAKLTTQGSPLVTRPGPEMLATRAVYFEQWCIDALTEVLGKEKWLRPWLAPRRVPYAYVQDTTLYLPSKSPIEISAAQAIVLQACDGERTAKQLATELSRTYRLAVKSEGEVYKLLEQLCAMGLIIWTLEVPFATYPERNLRRVLERIGDRRLREPALAALTELETARDAVTSAAGIADTLDRAIAGLETRFTQLTGLDATRAAGSTYAARTLVYEDCRRDIEVEIGPHILAALGPPLSLLLQSARWFTFETATVYRTAFNAIYSQIAHQTGSSIVDAASVWHQVQLHLLGDAPRPVGEIVRQFQERWAAILDLPPEQRQVEYTSEQLQAQVQSAFGVPHAGWSGARYHSPDVMIAAESVEAIQRGAYQLVMGELHLASNTLRGSFFIQQHPAPAKLLQAVDADFPEPRVVAVPPRNWPEITSRTRPDLITPRDFRLTFTKDAYGVPKAQELPIGSLIVVDDGAGPVIRTRDGQQQIDIVEFFADILSLEVVDGFKLLSPSRHTPRITIDRLVICRETWRFAPDELPFVMEKSDADRFLAARRWAHTHDLPRHMFVKISTERKPFYIDFDSPILVAIFAKNVRRVLEQGAAAGSITLSEMLPAIDQAWLPDADNCRYTSELRIVAVDQAGSTAVTNAKVS